MTKKPYEYTAEESKDLELPKWVKGFFWVVMVLWGFPLMVFGPLWVLNHYTGIIDTGPVSDDGYCTPSLYGGCQK